MATILRSLGFLSIIRWLLIALAAFRTKILDDPFEARYGFGFGFLHQFLLGENLCRIAGTPGLPCPDRWPCRYRFVAVYLFGVFLFGVVFFFRSGGTLFAN